MHTEFLRINGREHPLIHVGPCGPGWLRLTAAEPFPILKDQTNYILTHGNTREPVRAYPPAPALTVEITPIYW